MFTKRHLLIGASTMAEKPKSSACKRRKFSYLSPLRQTPNWSALPPKILKEILSKLSLMDILSFKAVCRSWCSVARSYISAPSHGRVLQKPLLIKLTIDEEDGAANLLACSLEEKKVYRIKNVEKQLGTDPWCLGSSHGWLVLLDDLANPFLLNPFSGVRIELPLARTFPSLHDYSDGFLDDFWRKEFISKAILFPDPSSHDNNYGVMIIYGLLSRLAFCRKGDTEWMDISARYGHNYLDMIYHGDELYTLGNDGSVDMWDTIHSYFPNRKRHIEPPQPRKLVIAQKILGDSHYSRLYLVGSGTDLLLVVKFIESSSSICQQSDSIDEAEQVSKEESKTLVFKLDFSEEEWVEVESLQDRVLFLGGNDSLSVSAQDFPQFEANTIHFTDDKMGRIESQCFWIVPSLQ